MNKSQSQLKSVRYLPQQCVDFLSLGQNSSYYPPKVIPKILAAIKSTEARTWIRSNFMLMKMDKVVPLDHQNGYSRAHWTSVMKAVVIR